MNIESIKQVSNQSLLSVHERESLLMDAMKFGKQQVFSDSDLKVKQSGFNPIIYNKQCNNSDYLLIGKNYNKRV